MLTIRWSLSSLGCFNSNATYSLPMFQIFYRCSEYTLFQCSCWIHIGEFSSENLTYKTTPQRKKFKFFTSLIYILPRWKCWIIDIPDEFVNFRPMGWVRWTSLRWYHSDNPSCLGFCRKHRVPCWRLFPEYWPKFLGHGMLGLTGVLWWAGSWMLSISP